MATNSNKAIKASLSRPSTKNAQDRNHEAMYLTAIVAVIGNEDSTDKVRVDAQVVVEAPS